MRMNHSLREWFELKEHLNPTPGMGRGTPCTREVTRSSDTREVTQQSPSRHSREEMSWLWEVSKVLQHQDKNQARLRMGGSKWEHLWMDNTGNADPTKYGIYRDMDYRELYMEHRENMEHREL